VALMTRVELRDPRRRTVAAGTVKVLTATRLHGAFWRTSTAIEISEDHTCRLVRSPSAFSPADDA
jgi:hypothetical protein